MDEHDETEAVGCGRLGVEECATALEGSGTVVSSSRSGGITGHGGCGAATADASGAAGAAAGLAENSATANFVTVAGPAQRTHVQRKPTNTGWRDTVSVHCLCVMWPQSSFATTSPCWYHE